MPTAKKITTFLLTIIVPISLISGYFCYAMPQMAQALDMPAMGNISACGEMNATEHYMTPKDTDTGALALCCVAKREHSDIGVLSISEWSPSDTNQPSAPANVDNGNFDSQLILENYPISPPQVKLLASVIKIE